MSRHAAEVLEIPQILDYLAHYLPAQGPIGVFVHHNTLHAFEELDFEIGVVEAAQRFGREPFWPEARYREAYERARIRRMDLDAILKAEPESDSQVLPGLARWEFREKLLLGDLRQYRPETIRWQRESEDGVAEGFEFWLGKIEARGDTLRLARRPQEYLKQRWGIDADAIVHPILIRLTGAFLDQGLAYWPMADRHRGFWQCATEILRQPGIVLPGGLEKCGKWLEKVKSLGSREALEYLLGVLGTGPEDWIDLLEAELLALPGWAGMMRQLESDPGLSPHERVLASLQDFAAVRMLLTVAVCDEFLPHPRYWRNEFGQRERRGLREERRWVEAARLADAARVLGVGTAEIQTWSEGQVERFVAEIQAFGDWERRRVWHLAFERRHEREVLLPLGKHARIGSGAQQRIRSQVFFCIDDREESIRRHLEEVDPEIETFGAAGFFGVAMDYQGIDDARGVSMCPVVMKPGHAVEERAAEGAQDEQEKRVQLRKAWASWMREAFVGSRSLARGWAGTTLLGVLSIFPLAARILSPRRYAKLMQQLQAAVLPEPRTELQFMRQDGSTTKGLLQGFAAEEKVERVGNLLAQAGLKKTFGRVVAVLGHGSTSINNPHESAYDCGACGGRKGGPNARIFAAMANRPEVREGLRSRGIHIPEDTYFIGGFHDTTSDAVEFFDLELAPASHLSEIAQLGRSLDEARARDAHERSRRFDHADDKKAAVASLHHVEERSQHLGEPRPEYGHSTNAVAFVGRRSTTRGLFLDRRAFLISYDAELDPQDENLSPLLHAVIPVCAGINLEYYFSSVDNEGYGCGTKLPHNVNGLLGVVNGSEGDLRTGLTLQMVEIHEPVRLLFVVETTRERLMATIQASDELMRLVENRWIRLGVMDPKDGGSIAMYRGKGKWEEIVGDDAMLPRSAGSRAWYEGRSEHLPLARIEKATQV